MKKQIVRFSVLQTSIVSGILYAFIGFLIGLFALLFAIFSGEHHTLLQLTAGVVIGIFVYGILGALGTAVGCVFYNIVAKGFGGIEFYLEDQDK
jgi:hypothetical protein